MGFGDKTILSEADVEHFLLRLATDDDFRYALESNPEKVLQEYGITVEPAPGVIPDTVTLPDKQNILDNLDSYVDKIRGEDNGIYGFIWYIL